MTTWPTVWKDELPPFPGIANKFSSKNPNDQQRNSSSSSRGASPSAGTSKNSSSQSGSSQYHYAPTEVDEQDCTSEESTRSTYGSEFGGTSAAHAEKKRKAAETNARQFSSKPPVFQNPEQPMSSPSSSKVWAEPTGSFAGSSARSASSSHLFDTTTPPGSPQTPHSHHPAS